MNKGTIAWPGTWRGLRAVVTAVLILAAAGVMGSCDRDRKPEPADEGPLRVTILFFNDLHGYLLPFTVKQDDGSKAEVGGIARLAGVVKKVRAENEQKGVATLVLVAGDILQGTPMSTVFQGKPDVEALNELGVNAMTVGNHEFDFGLSNFRSLKLAAAFPFLSCNIVWKDTDELVVEPFKTFPVADSISLSVIGVTTQDLMFTTKPENVRDIGTLDPVREVPEYYRRLSGHGPVILLSHSKAAVDEEIARKIPELTAIIGGHDQILMNPRKLAGRVPIYQAFEKGKYLGRLDLVIDRDTRRAREESWSYIAITADLPEDPQTAAIVARYRSQLDAKFSEVIGTSLVFLDGERERIRYRETTLGNFVTDIMREYTGAEIALLNAGSLRASIDEGPVTLEEVFNAMPYENELVSVELTGAEIISALTRSVQGAREDEDGGFLHVSGIRFQVRGGTPRQIEVGNQAIIPENSYRVAITDFMASGGDGYQLFVGKAMVKTGLPLRELIVDTIRSRGEVEAHLQDRIERMD